MSRGRRALWWTIFVILAWMFWNLTAAAPFRFDPYPYVWLMGIITELSYLQNIVIMTDQETAAKYLDKVQQSMLRMLEGQAATGQVTLEHVKTAAQRDIFIMEQLGKIEHRLNEIQLRLLH